MTYDEFGRELLVTIWLKEPLSQMQQIFDMYLNNTYNKTQEEGAPRIPRYQIYSAHDFNLNNVLK